MVENKTYIHHLRIVQGETLLGNGGVTVALRKLGEGVYEAGLAFCSPADNYNRRIGKMIAEGRRQHGKKLTLLYDGESLDELLRAIYEAASESPGIEGDWLYWYDKIGEYWGNRVLDLRRRYGQVIHADLAGITCTTTIDAERKSR